MNTLVSEQRKALLHKLIGKRIPRLWCPPLTHYMGDGELDTARQAAHWAVMSAHVGGFLVPGSTGDGWEMVEDEIDDLLDATLDLCVTLDTRILIGVLKTDVDAMCATVTRWMDILKTRTGSADAVQAMQQSRVCGFTICPPQGADLSQAQIQAGLEAVLALDAPTAIYQLPQVTENEMSPAIVADLADRYPNFILFKDTSGEDRVPLADQGRSGVYLVRGAEGNYIKWLREGGGPYDGLLLSTANSFPAQLGEIITLAEAGNTAAAQALSERLTCAVDCVFDLVKDIPYGNAFANANKAIDHWMAHGPGAIDIVPPLLHAGARLSPGVIRETGIVLSEANFLPDHGYLQT